MNTRVSCSSEDDTLTIRVVGSLDFGMHRAFRDAYETAPPQIMNYVLDLSETTRLDSSALGMLLLLRDHAGGNSERVRLRGAHDNVQKTLSAMNFDQLFIFED